MIEIRDDIDDFNSVLWRFSVNSGFSGDITLRLSEYAVCERQTKRHSWKKVKHWSTYDERRSSIARHELPTIPDFIKHRGLQLLKIDFVMPEPRSAR